MRDIAILAIAIAFALEGCSSRCSTPIDCEANQVCTDGKCVPNPPKPPILTDDAGPPVLKPPKDGGSDGGIADVDSGPSDGPVTPLDSGIPDAGDTDANGGYVRLSSFNVNTSTAPVSEAEAKFTDTTGAQLARSEMVFTLANNQGDCTVRSIRLVHGATIAADAARVAFDSGFGELALDRVAAGVFRKRALPEALYPSNTITFRIQHGPPPYGLDDFTLSLASPKVFRIASPVPDNLPLELALLPPFSWTPSGAGMVRLELYDRHREAVLLCKTGDTGTLEVPVNAVTAWQSLGPKPPAFLELRYESDKIEVIGRSGAPSAIPTEFRAASGVRYSIDF